MLNFKLNFSLLALLLFYSSVFSQNPLLNENSVKFENSTTASLVGENGLIMKTTNNGVSWTEEATNVTNVLYGSSFSGGISLAAGENGVILRSIDNGTTWEPILPGTLENLNDIEISGLNAVVCGNNGIIYYSNDGGETWNLYSSGTTSNLKDVNFISDYTGFITGDYGTLLKTTDGGSTWISLNLSFSNGSFNSVEAIDENNLIVVGDFGNVFLSNDGGNSWFGPNGLVYESNFNDVVFFSSLEGVIVGDNGLILITNDGGMTWSTPTTNFSGDGYDLKSVAFYDANNGISVGVNGIEVYTTNGGITWSDNVLTRSHYSSQGSKTENIILKQNYPNPFNPATNISYDLPFRANVTMKVYDISGKEAASLFSGYQNPGTYTVHFDGSSLSSGVYFYKLNVQNGTNSYYIVNKMILSK